MPYYSTALFAVALNVPLLIFFCLAMMSHVPADWGRAASIAYGGLLSVFIAGLCAASDVHVALVCLLALCAVIGTGSGGPSGLLICSAGLLLAFLATAFNVTIPVHWSLPAAAGGLTLTTGVKWLIDRR